MRPIVPLLRHESPFTIAREAVWRARRTWQRKRVRIALRNAPEVRIRHVGYFRPRPDTCSAASRHTILGIANLLVDGRFAFLGYNTAALGIPPAWNWDFVSGQDWPQTDASRIPIVRHDGSDVKVPWELSRLQFLPVLAKAHLLSGEQRYLETAKTLVSQWIDQNPAGVGVNWTTAMEVALRAMSICFFVDLLWPLCDHEQLWIRKLTRSLWQHLVYIEANLEFSHIVRGNHYVSDLVGLLCLSTFLDGPHMERRRQMYQRRVEQEILRQTYEDGGDYEASTGYHVLVTQLFTCAFLLMKAFGVTPDAEFVGRLRKMYIFADALADTSDTMPQVGDCDDGRVELLLDDLEQMLDLPVSKRNSLRISSFLGTGSALFGDFGRGRLEDAAWYGLSRSPSTKAEERSPGSAIRPSAVVFPNSGFAFARHENWEVLLCAIPNGAQGKGSHTHNDKLSFVLRLNGEEVFSDSGTGVYSRDLAMRNYFRSTAAHNTVLVDGVEQNRISSLPGHLFLMGNEARVSPIRFQRISNGFRMSASHFGYHAFRVTHFRRVTLTGQGVTIEDILEGAGNHQVELNLHLSPAWDIEPLQLAGKLLACLLKGSASAAMTVSAPVDLHLEVESSPSSRCYGSSFSAQRVRVQGHSTLPVTIVTHIACEDSASSESCSEADEEVLPMHPRWRELGRPPSH
jgi:hypothetical protein